ncbi:MAG: hypothetical protein EPO26_16270 [Chloroflexota bacterium]|nr:MAG: hypothetical protein EPO26_16270 [Chloroflexota bacterium]
MGELAKGAADILRARIAERGPISFSEFVEIALYDPEWGYYSRVAVGRDFVTSPRTSPAFGHLLGRFVADAWHALDRPNPFFVAEFAAGDGTLGADILAWLSAREPGCAAATRYLAVDRQAVSDASGPLFRVRGDAAHPPTNPFDGVVLSNELFDALPFDRIVSTELGLRQTMVDCLGRDLVSRVGPAVTDAILRHFNALAIRPSIGQLLDVSVVAPQVYRALARSLRRGFIVTIDYGAEATDLYGSRHFAGTARGYSRHAAVDDLLVRPGEQDLTSHVDFTTLRRVGEEAGAQTVWSGAQADFLRALDLAKWIERLDPRHLSHVDYHNARFGALELVNPSGTGRFRVLVQSRGAPGRLDRLV